MKVILTRPFYHTHLITPPLGIGYLSSFIKAAGFEDVTIIDGLNRDLSNDEIVEECVKAECNIVGISIISDYRKEAFDLSKKLKKKGLTVVLGGPHVSALPKMSLEDSNADYAICGEGEVTFVELIRQIASGEKYVGNIPGLLSKGNAEITPRDFIEDLDSIPFPDWAQINPAKYKKAPHGGLIKNFPVAPVVSSRGCPFVCTFCASPNLWKKKIRFRSAKNVVDEIEYLVREFKIKEIHFEDDNLTLKRSHIEDICNEILSRNIRISWATPNGIRVETVTPELLKLMKESGCYYLAFGIESGNQQILDNIKKKTKLETIEYAVREASKAGILTQGFFIFGLPGETEETIQETINFAKKIPLDRAQFLLLDVLPGSELFETIGNSSLLNQNYRSYQEVSWLPAGLDRKTLQNAPARAFRSFFMRPKQLFSLLRFFNPSQLTFIIRRIRDFKIFKK
ncbi:MAG: radical SAM protein [Candidatus Schekmanbacteria bacterium]|nr:MAG: radical SAM protein [Candidatus Schekmanbacteria bacterium]